MRIGIDVRAIGRKRTGDETYTLQLVRGLANIDRENSYFLYTDTNDRNELISIGEKMNIPNENFSLVPVLPSSKALWTFRALPRQAKKDRLDVLHVQHISPLTLERKIKLITTVHDLSFERYPQFIKFKDRFFLKLLIPLSVERADKVIAVSDFTKREIVELYKAKPDHVVAIDNGGAEPKFFQSATEGEKLRLRKLLGFNDPYILYLGTLQPRKNIPTLLESYAKLINDSKGVQKVFQHDLVIAGLKKGPNYDKKIDRTLKKIFRENRELEKKIHFPGYLEVELLPALYQQATLFCFPTLYEGFGLPMIESMAGGTPVVSSSASCLPEIGKGAVLFFDPKKKNSLTKSMLEVILNQHLAEALSAGGREVARGFSWEKCARQTLDLYEEVVQNG